MNKYYIIPLLLTGILTLTVSIFPEAMRCLLVHRQDSITLLSLTTRQPHGSLVLMPHGLMPEIVCMTT